ncbi:uncharacterized protein LOC142140069 [Mixophyes fleayi]|uniref:uncharacterized protein LOC142140069 n=1 Tax=Mixophyes fleayi TaxID=3061075 RepID=UPI003F4DF5F6
MRGHRRRGSGRSLSARRAVCTDSKGTQSVSGTQSYSQCERRGKSYKWHARQMRPDNGQVRVHGWEEERGVRQRCRLQSTHKSRQEVEAQPNPPPVLNTLGKGRMRNFRFSNAENMILISRLVLVYEQLLGKQKPTIPLFRRTLMWQEICDAVNRVGNRQRFVHHCKKRFSDIKRQLKNKLNREKSNECNQGGLVFYTQYEEELKKVLPAEIIDGIEFFDSDCPQDSFLHEDAGPSLCSQHHDQELQLKGISLSVAELQYNATSEPVQTQLSLEDLLEEQWHMLPDICPALTVESRNLSTGPIDPQLRFDNSTTREQSSPHTSPNTTPPPRSVQPPSKHLKILKATQWLFRKGMMHNLNVLRLDVHQLTDGINKNNVTSKNMLKLETQRNSILHQMNNTIEEVAESIQLLTNQQQAERILLNDFLGVQRSRRKERLSSIRGSSVTAHTASSAHRSCKGRRSLRTTSSSLMHRSDPGFLSAAENILNDARKLT